MHRLSPDMSFQEVQRISMLGLAHVGDGVYELLTDPSLRIGEIGERVGYADTAHFARVFKKLTGMSANEYRNSL